MCSSDLQFQTLKQTYEAIEARLKEIDGKLEAEAKKPQAQQNEALMESLGDQFSRLGEEGYAIGRELYQIQRSLAPEMIKLLQGEATAFTNNWSARISKYTDLHVRTRAEYQAEPSLKPVEVSRLERMIENGRDAGAARRTLSALEGLRQPLWSLNGQPGAKRTAANPRAGEPALQRVRDALDRTPARAREA